MYKIGIVSDNPLTRQLLKHLISNFMPRRKSDMEWRIETITGKDFCGDCIHSSAYDLLILEEALKGTTGTKCVCHMIECRDSQHLESLPVPTIIFVSTVSKAILSERLNGYADRIPMIQRINKPVVIKELQERINGVLPYDFDMDAQRTITRCMPNINMSAYEAMKVGFMNMLNCPIN